MGKKRTKIKNLTAKEWLRGSGKKYDKKYHRHTWENNDVFCGNCGFYEEYCKNCDVSRRCSPKGKCVTDE